eukprot:1158440-Pelagomonas_calceolata.AAC.1
MLLLLLGLGLAHALKDGTRELRSRPCSMNTITALQGGRGAPRPQSTCACVLGAQAHSLQMYALLGDKPQGSVITAVMDGEGHARQLSKKQRRLRGASQRLIITAPGLATWQQPCHLTVHACQTGFAVDSLPCDQNTRASLKHRKAISA